MDSLLCRELNLIRDRIDLSDDGEGTLAVYLGLSFMQGRCILMSLVNSQTF